MLEMTLSQIAGITGGALSGGDAVVRNVVIDSRQVTEGSLFVALRGEQVDGHEYVQKALENGAAAALVEKPVACALPQVVVPSCLKALADVARAHRQTFSGVVFGITGSCGKTSTKEMLVSILSLAGPVVATQGNLNNEIGVPLTVFNLDNRYRYAVVEMGAAQKGDIAYLMAIAEPDITAITNVGTAHLGRFGSVDMIASTKGEIYSSLKATGKAVVNADMVYAAGWLQGLSGRPVKTFSIQGVADIHASDLVLGSEGSSFLLHYGEQQSPVTLAVPGLHNVANALCAAAMVCHAGVAVETVVRGLAAFRPVSSRLQKLTGFWGGALIDDCYNANPGSVRAAIDVLACYPGRRILVLGDMAELGDASRQAHASVGDYAREKGLDMLLTCGIDSAEASRVFGANGLHFSNKPDVVSYLRTNVKANDVVLVKGSRSAAMESIVQSMVAGNGESTIDDKLKVAH